MATRFDDGECENGVVLSGGNVYRPTDGADNRW